LAFGKHAQNGVRREPVPNPLEGARRTLCAFGKHAQNGVRRESVPNPLEGARRTLCAFGLLAYCRLAGLRWRNCHDLFIGPSGEFP
jgi:hypothetical protein